MQVSHRCRKPHPSKDVPGCDQVVVLCIQQDGTRPSLEKIALELKAGVELVEVVPERVRRRQAAHGPGKLRLVRRLVGCEYGVSIVVDGEQKETQSLTSAANSHHDISIVPDVVGGSSHLWEDVEGVGRRGGEGHRRHRRHSAAVRHKELGCGDVRCSRL
jgi:hypothetical protein